MIPLFYIMALAGVALGQLNGSTVTLDYGTFNGVLSQGVASFLGVRYADPPVKSLRWRPPVVPPSSNLGIVNASVFAPICIATTIGATAIPAGQSEDCLYTNVYAPVGASELLPVLVYFHGGGFANGGTHGYLPTYMMAASTAPYVFVTFEYRLGGFGFLGGEEVGKNGTYNVGLLDQRAGLRWIQQYISQFGGNPSQVKIWGESAGAASVMFHLIANGGDSEGLFQGAMGDSVSLSFMPQADASYDQSVFNDVALLAGCTDLSTSNNMTCLRGVNSTVLATAMNGVAAARYELDATLYVFAPRVDGSFLSSAPVEAFKSGKFVKVPGFFGSNTAEGSNWSATLPERANTSSPDATQDTVYNFLRGQFSTLTRASFRRALGLYPLADYGNYSLQGQQMYGEMRYICSSILITKAMKACGLPAYSYSYNDDHLGSFHGAELYGLFSPPATTTALDAAFFVKQRQYWTSFATGGAPVAAAAPVWESVNGTDGSPRISLDPKGITMNTIPAAQTKRCDFWHGLSHELKT